MQESWSIFNDRSSSSSNSDNNGSSTSSNNVTILITQTAYTWIDSLSEIWLSSSALSSIWKADDFWSKSPSLSS